VVARWRDLFMEALTEPTWNANSPWCDVLMNNVFSMFPTMRGRKTTSNEVLPPGGRIWRKDINKETNINIYQAIEV